MTGLVLLLDAEEKCYISHEVDSSGHVDPWDWVIHGVSREEEPDIRCEDLSPMRVSVEGTRTRVSSAFVEGLDLID